ncbi:hypothetical protein JCM10212_002842 [Sporobolomyces blumeae]
MADHLSEKGSSAAPSPHLASTGSSAEAHHFAPLAPLHPAGEPRVEQARPIEQADRGSLERRKAATNKTVVSGVALVVLFWVSALWLFGLFYHNAENAHRLRILVVDFDGGSVGAALLSAVSRVNGQKTWPTFVVDRSSGTTPALVQQRVLEGSYWGAIWSSEGATARFEAAIAGDSAAATYNASDAIYYTGNEVRYNTAWSAFVLAPITRVLQSASYIFGQQTVAPLLAKGSSYGSQCAAVLADPLAATFINLVPFEFGSRIIYNTIGFVFPTLFQFFFLLGLNGIWGATGAYRNMSLAQHYMIRLPLSVVWTFVTALCLVGWDLMFKESFDIAPKNFFALWAVVWLNNWITFLVFDNLLTFIPPAAYSFPTMLWIILSVSSVIYPLELGNVFYRVHYAVPAHATWAIMITVLSHGGCNTLRYNLPILFAWLVAMQGVWFLALRKRARDGRQGASPSALSPSTGKRD